MKAQNLQHIVKDKSSGLQIFLASAFFCFFAFFFNKKENVDVVAFEMIMRS